MATAESAYLRNHATAMAGALESPRHSVVVRATHWINTLSFIGLLISGFAILLAHPRFYWGETGGIGVPSIIALPLPFMKGGPSGWGRNLHFLAAWVCVLNGLLYTLSGILTRHFRRKFLSAASASYNPMQRLTYLAVVFGLLPFLVWTGFAMSPAITSIAPALVNVLGGQQSARTLHFLVAVALVLFFFVHLAMVYAAGFKKHVWAMIAGHGTQGKERP